MAANSNIEWCNHTFNPWVGCTKVSDGCKNCYAETLMDKRYGKTKWGPNGLRVIKADSGWREPHRWNRLAKEAGERHRVFCASLADVFEGPETMPAASVPTVRATRLRLFRLIRQTGHLDWLLLTKRPENVLRVICEAAEDANAKVGFKHIGSHDESELDDPSYYPDREFLSHWAAGGVPSNIWLGTSIENQEQADKRSEELRCCPAAVRFYSIEPMLGSINKLPLDGISWVICGGESGPGARPCNIEWIRSIVRQCKAAKVPCFVKQLGAWIAGPHDFDGWKGLIDRWLLEHADGTKSTCTRPILRSDYCPEFYDQRPVNAVAWGLPNKKGGDIDEFPADLRVREFPKQEASNV